MTVVRSDWSHLACNGCYGRLLSLYEIRTGAADTGAIADELAEALLGFVSDDDARRAEDILRVSDACADVLEPKALRLLATAEYVASHLAHGTELDWSAAIIGVCKAVEIEAVRRIVDPLAAATRSEDLSSDVADKDIGRVARYCTNRMSKPPELGAIRHLLTTAAHSQERQQSSHSRALRDPAPPLATRRLAVCPGRWRRSPRGGHDQVSQPRRPHRGVRRVDYRACVDEVLGETACCGTSFASSTPR